MKRLLLLTGILIGCKLTTALGKGTGVLGFIENKGQIIDQHGQPNPAVKYLWDGERLINLKVILKDDFISVFYNDLMLYSLQNNYNQTANVHGMINTGWSSSGTPQNAFYSKSFKLLIH